MVEAIEPRGQQKKHASRSRVPISQASRHDAEPHAEPNGIEATAADRGSGARAGPRGDHARPRLDGFPEDLKEERAQRLAERRHRAVGRASDRRLQRRCVERTRKLAAQRAHESLTNHALAVKRLVKDSCVVQVAERGAPHGGHRRRRRRDRRAMGNARPSVGRIARVSTPRASAAAAARRSLGIGARPAHPLR